MSRPLLIVCSSGGHLLQMLELRDAWSGFERVWVTFDKSDARSLLREERVVHAHGPTNRNVPNLLRIPTIYVESVTRIEGLSLSARMIAPVASQLYGQWPELAAGSGGRVRFAGNVLEPR